MKDEIIGILEDKIPTDSSDQFDAFQMLRRNSQRISSVGRRLKLMDLGAGDGRAYERFAAIFKDFAYVGLDIGQSPEVSNRDRSDLHFQTYDGRNMPFHDSEFDVVFCRQVLEHVRHPDLVVSEVSRVLKPGGVFVGSVSQLEPYHSYSIFNWTAYAIVTVFQSHGILVHELMPGIDGISLIMRRLFGKEKFNHMFASQSIFNHYLEVQLSKSNVWTRNFNKLMVAGHIVWWAENRKAG